MFGSSDASDYTAARLFIPQVWEKRTWITELTVYLGLRFVLKQLWDHNLSYPVVLIQVKASALNVTVLLKDKCE